MLCSLFGEAFYNSDTLSSFTFILFKILRNIKFDKCGILQHWPDNTKRISVIQFVIFGICMYQVGDLLGRYPDLMDGFNGFLARCEKNGNCLKTNTSVLFAVDVDYQHCI